MSTYVVTGGAGFIGSHIAEALVRGKHRVRIVDNFSSGKESNLEPFRSSVEVFQIDIASGAGLAEAFSGADYVIHQAAIPSVPKSMLDPVTSNRANVDGTLNVLMAARDAKVKRLVYASSSSLYGDSPTLPKHEGMTPNPLSPYGAQKLFAEIYCQVFWKAYQFETVALRYFNVFGPRQDPKSPYSGVIAIFSTLMKQGKTPTIFGDGLQARDFVHVSDVVQALRLAADSKKAVGRVYNIGTGRSVNLLELVKHLNEILGTKITPIHQPPRAGDVRVSQACIRRAREELGYEPAVSFRDGLAKTLGG